MPIQSDEFYRELILEPLRTCASYQPRFGHGHMTEFSITNFYDLYGGDPFYNWLGLDNDLVYIAHKASGGITSIYRQIGIGSERLIRNIFMDSLGIQKDRVTWSYEIKTASGKMQRLYLDARITFNDLTPERRTIVRQWCLDEAHRVGIDDDVAESLKGIVFEVRQGYKSKDSKRQNADLNNASNAYANGYLPCLMIISSQIDDNLVARYESSKWILLKGILNPDALVSTYAFLDKIIGFDFVGFMERNQSIFQDELHNILSCLLTKELK